MSTNISVIVPTFGNRVVWSIYADRAIESVRSQTIEPDNILWAHAENLMVARNGPVESVKSKWLIFLDADDELDSGYIEAMIKHGTGTINRPSTLGVQIDGTEDDHPVMIPKRDINRSNYIVIGAMIEREAFLDVGGFRDYPILEDWDLFGRMIKAGATVVDVYDAVYRVTVRPQSRNTDTKLHHKVYRQIRKDLLS